MEQTDPRALLIRESRSNRHLEDAESVLKISETELDTEYLKKWAKELGVLDEFKRLLNVLL